MSGVAGAVSRKLTGHRSEELERYKHFPPGFKQQTVELMAERLNEVMDTKGAYPPKRKKPLR